MLEVHASMASIDLAMEIAPSESPKPNSSDVSREAEQAAEPFRSVLARAQDHGRREQVKPAPKAREGPSEEPDAGSREVDENDLPDSPAGGEAPTESAAQSPEDATTATDSKSAAVTAEAATAATSASYSRSGLGNALSMLLSELPTASLDGAIVNAESEGLSSGTALTLPSERASVLPVSELPQSAMDDATAGMTARQEPSGQAPSTSPSLGESRSSLFPRPPAVPKAASGPELPIFSANERAGPTQGARTAPSSEWTEVIELNRLLRPSAERESMVKAPRPQAAEPQRSDASTRQPRPLNPERPTWQPRPRLEPPESSRAATARPSGNQSSGPPQKSATDAFIWRPAFDLDPSRQTAALRQLDALLSNGVKSDSQASLQATPSGVVADVIPLAQVAPRGPLTATAQQIDAETLVADVRQAVIRLTADGQGQARVVLHPPELGELVVRLESAKNGVVRAEFHTFSPLVREALEAGLTKLTEALEAEGLTLAQAEVHLSFHLGPETQNGDGAFETADGAYMIDRLHAEQTTEISQDITEAVERLPEGSTISIYA